MPAPIRSGIRVSCSNRASACEVPTRAGGAILSYKQGRLARSTAWASAPIWLRAAVKPGTPPTPCKVASDELRTSCCVARSFSFVGGRRPNRGNSPTSDQANFRAIEFKMSGAVRDHGPPDQPREPVPQPLALPKTSCVMPQLKHAHRRSLPIFPFYASSFKAAERRDALIFLIASRALPCEVIRASGPISGYRAGLAPANSYLWSLGLALVSALASPQSPARSPLEGRPPD